MRVTSQPRNEMEARIAGLHAAATLLRSEATADGRSFRSWCGITAIALAVSATASFADPDRLLTPTLLVVGPSGSFAARLAWVYFRSRERHRSRAVEMELDAILGERRASQRG